MDNWFTIEQIDRDTFSISEYKTLGRNTLLSIMWKKNALFSLIQA